MADKGWARCTRRAMEWGIGCCCGAWQHRYLRLLKLDAAVSLNSLRVQPGNHLEALKGDRKGQHSIRINDQWRICFVWTDAGPENVIIEDYH